ncbi:MAG: DUF359 domain-containing protein [Promethearchaeota archaeon]|nr:MAG: DUF359 domain-containing protein [Candidatus Lokiarchaeota archaeon]
MGKDLKIPVNQRHKFSQPLGKLIAGSREDTISNVIELLKDLKKKNQIINCYLVGDVVTEDFINNDFLRSLVKVSIIDGKTKRNHISLDLRTYFEEIYEMENPESGINPDSFEIFKSIIESNKKTLIKITRGEEDLLVLPLIVALPIKESITNIVFYGQPPITDSKTPIPEGIVMVKVDQSIIKVVKQFIALMAN